MKTILSLLLLAALAVPASGQVTHVPDIITWDGYAFSWPIGDRKKWRSGDPLRIGDVVAARSGRYIEADCTLYMAVLRGATFCFANAANRAVFLAATKDGENPFVPLYGGRCALGTSWGMAEARGDPKTLRVMRIHGEPVVVLQSASKWWRDFMEDRDHNLSLANLTYRIYRGTGVMLPNDKMPPAAPPKQ